MISIIEKRAVPSENSSNINLCDPSFSSFLNDTDDTFLRKLVHSSPSLNSIVPSPSHNAYIPKKKVLDGEIGIFGAEKYFTGAIDEERSVISTRGNSPKSSHDHQQDREERVFDECPVKHNKTRTGTPSVRSEASWNSRSALLQSSSRNQPQKEANKVKSFLASLGCNCNGNDSVKVRKTTGEDRGVQGKLEITKPIKNGDLVVRTTKSLSSRWAEEENQSKKLDRSSSKREDCFSFPVVNSKAGDQTVKTDQLQEEKEIVRNSLEVFGSPIMEKAKKSFSLERKLTTLNWDGVTTRVQDIKIAPPPNQNGTYDDTASDASSDLFEIESFSTNGNSFLGRQASEGGGMLNPSNCYAPSEASIDWSVATASAADFAVISEYNELRKGGIAKSSSTIAWNMKSRDKQGNDHEVVVQKRAPGILSGCASLKSVRVAGDEYRTTTTTTTTTTTDQKVAAIGSPRVMHHRLDSATPIAKFQAEAKLTGFDSRSRGQNNGFVTHTLPRSHSPHLLYIQ